MPYPSVGYEVKNEERFPGLWEHTPEEKEYLLKRCAMVGAERSRAYMLNAWIENDEDGFTGWRWVKHNRALRLVSAANRYKDIIVTGARHSCPIMNLTMAVYGGMEILHEYSGKDHEQGFIDQYGTFHNRVEALTLAKANGQLLYPDEATETKLFSEGLY